MAHDVDAIYDSGTLHPLHPLPIPDGARVHLRVEESKDAVAGDSSRASGYEAWLDGLPGRWHGEFARGSEGDFEVREPLS